MALDFPQEPKSRFQLYIQALRAAHERGDKQCFGAFVHRHIEDRDGDWVHLYCAMGIILRDVFSITEQQMMDQSIAFVNACAVIRQDLYLRNFHANFIMECNDRDEMTFAEIADALEKALVTV